jgi:hypothetical protein
METFIKVTIEFFPTKKDLTALYQRTILPNRNMKDIFFMKAFIKPENLEEKNLAFYFAVKK